MAEPVTGRTNRLDPRIVAGMAAQLRQRDLLLETGWRQIGWKLGFGTRQAREALGSPGPLVGYLTEATLVESGGSCSIRAHADPRIEAEIAVYLGNHVPPHASRAVAHQAVEAIGPAIEVVDLGGALDDVEDLLAGNVAHRQVILGPREARRPGLDVSGLAVEVRSEDGVLARTETPTAATGDLLDLVRYTADYLAAFDCDLTTGDVLIAGSAIPPISIDRDQHLECALVPVGSAEVRIIGT